MKRAFAAIFSVAAMVFFMAGCSSVRLVDTDVTAFSRWSAAPPGPGTPYRFERLPSQQTVAAQQDPVEAYQNALETHLDKKTRRQTLEQLADSGQLKQYRLLHFATHGAADLKTPHRSRLILAQDKLPSEEEKLLAIRAKTKVYIKFRTSPSVANNVTRSLDDLRPMIGWPVTLKIARRGDGVVASQVIAWRGTPWKDAPAKAVR